MSSHLAYRFENNETVYSGQRAEELARGEKGSLDKHEKLDGHHNYSDWSNRGPGYFLGGKHSEGKDCLHPSAAFSVTTTVPCMQLTPKYLSQGTLGCNYQKVILTCLAKKKNKKGMSRKYSAAPSKAQKPALRCSLDLLNIAYRLTSPSLFSVNLLLDQKGHPRPASHD